MNTTSGTGLAAPPAPTHVVLARHGQTDHNLQQRLQGQIDIPLNDVGRQQALALARTMQQDPPDVVYCSPLSRAMDTARTVADQLRATIIADDAFLERGFGQWEGLTREEIRDGWPEQYTEWIEQRPVIGMGVESRTVVADRVGDACRRLAREHTGATVLVVAHGAAITLGITGLLGLDAEDFRGIGGMSNCHRSVLEPRLADPEGRTMRLLSHNLAPSFA